eukprot:948368-Amphidinium_carterae.1
MEARQNDRIIYDLNEQNIEYITHLPGDTAELAAEDDTRRRQIVRLEDDIESIIDEEYYTRRQRGEQDIWAEEYSIPDARREQQARDRQVGRDEGVQTRFKGTKEELQ